MEFEIGQRYWRFHGGLRLRHWKKISISEPLDFVGIPPQLILPLKQHVGVTATPLAYPGERVLKGHAHDESPEQQTVVRVTNRWSGEDVLHSPLRGARPVASGARSAVEREIEGARQQCDFCDPAKRTTADSWGRVESCIYLTQCFRTKKNH